MAEPDIAALLLASGRTLAVAESCTGGKITDRLTDRPGASRYFLGGVVAYSDESKHALLGVDRHILESQGAVSEAAARAMALGVRRAFHADVGLAVTGIAGPTGGTPTKRVGTIHLAATAEGLTLHRKLELSGSREEIKQGATDAAFELLFELLTGPGR